MKRYSRINAAVWLSAALAVAGCSTPPQKVAQQTEIKRLVVFGDSNVDNGNLYRMTSEGIPAAPRWHGRESNGPLVVEYLAEGLGAKLDDYAVSGATSGIKNIIPLVVPKYTNVANTGVTWQLDEYTKAGGRFAPSDVVVLWAGSNDIFGAKRQETADLKRRIDTATENTEQALTRLHELGAKRVIFATRTPREVIGNENDLNGVDLNAAMLNSVKNVQAKTGMEIIVYDAYARVSEMMTNPAKYGFSDVRTLCVTVPTCAQDKYGLGQPVASKYINWDGAHKTTHVHKLMADEIQAILQH